VSLIGHVHDHARVRLRINALSLFACVAHRIVVDDAIVVVENVERTSHAACHLMMAAGRHERSHRPIGRRRLVLCAVFVPTASSRPDRQFYKQFALTIAISRSSSAFNSLTLSPVCARCCSKIITRRKTGSPA